MGQYFVTVWIHFLLDLSVFLWGIIFVDLDTLLCLRFMQTSFWSDWTCHFLRSSKLFLWFLELGFLLRRSNLLLFGYTHFLVLFGVVCWLGSCRLSLKTVLEGLCY